MAEQEKKFVIEVFRNKNAEDFTKALSDPKGKLETGSAAAAVAASAMALLCRAAAIAAEETQGNDRLDYIVRNTEIIRGYMVHLIDEDIKCRGPLARAMKDGNPQNIEAARQPAVSICAEIVNMLSQAIELAVELCDYSKADSLHYIGEAVTLSIAAMKAARLYIVSMADKSSDDTYRFVIRRENEISIENSEKLANAVLLKVEAAI